MHFVLGGISIVIFIMLIYLLGDYSWFNGNNAVFAAATFPVRNVENLAKLYAGDALNGALAIKYDTMSTTGCEMCQIAIYRPNMAGNKGVAAVAYSSNETLDLTGANRIVFFAKGELGGERLSFLAIGGPSNSSASTVPFTNLTFSLVTNNITLANDWTRYELSLNGTDLTNIEYPFAFIVERGRNNSALEQPDGDNPPLNNPSTSQITLYLKGITFDTDPAESPLNATTTGQALNATTTGQALNATTTGQALNATTTGQALNATTTGQALNATTTGQALNATTTGQALNATTTGQALNATTTGQALNATTTGQALNATTTGQALNATTTGQALNAKPIQLTNDTSKDTVWNPIGPITQNNFSQSQLSAEDNLFKAEITESSNGHCNCNTYSRDGYE